MTLEAQGAYWRLVCHAWLCETPGFLPDDDETLAALSGAGERWPALRDQVMAAFTKCEPDASQNASCWSHPRLLEEREKQLKRLSRAKAGGVARWTGIEPEARAEAGKSLAGKRWKKPSEPDASGVRASMRAECVPLPLESKKNLESKHSSPDGDTGVVKREWQAAYDNDFYPSYPARGEPPRKTNREKGRKVWMTLAPKTTEDGQALFDRIDEALARDVESWKLGSPKFIPMIDVWLRRKAWED